MVHFQEYWIRLRAEVPAEAVVVVGLDDATPAPGVIDAITDADLVVLPPSNPVVSVGTILGVPRVREAIVATAAPVVGLSPIIGGAHVRGMAEQLLTSIGVEVSAAGVGLHYGARSAGGVLDGWLVDSRDAGDLDRLHAGRARGSRRTAADDRRRGHRGDGGRGDRPGPYAVSDRTVSATAPDGVPEVRPGDDLVALLLPLVDLEDGDVVVVTSKVVSKAEGRLLAGDDRDAAIEQRVRPGGRPARADHHRAHRATASPWPRPGSTTPTSRSGCWSCSPSTRTPRRVGSGPASPSAPASTWAWWSPTPPAGPGARGRPTSRSAPRA